MRARVLALAVAATAATPTAAQAVVAVTGSSSRLPTGVAVTVKNTGNEDIRFLRLLFGPSFTATPQTAPCQGGGPGEVFCPLAPGALKPGGQLTLEQLLAPLFPDGTPIAGRASADGMTDILFSIPGPVAGPAAGAPDIAVDLTGDAATTPGATVRYRLTIRNVGTATSRAGSVAIGFTSTIGIFSGFNSDTFSQDPRAKRPGFGDLAFGALQRLVVPFPALEPGGSSQAEFDVEIRAQGGRFREEGLLFFDEIGARTLTATLQDADPEPGPNADSLRTVFENREPPVDSAIRPPKGAPREISGTASGSAGGVEVAVVRTSGGAVAAAATCNWLASARGTFKRTPATARRCRTPVWLKATGTKRWKLRLSRRLARGRYVVYSRAITKDGAPEVRFSAKDGNRLALTVR